MRWEAAIDPTNCSFKQDMKAVSQSQILISYSNVLDAFESFLHDQTVHQQIFDDLDQGHKKGS